MENNMSERTSLLSKPLTFQVDRGPLSQDSLYFDMGFQFIIAPNRYRKLAGKTPRDMPDEDAATIALEHLLDEMLLNDPNTKFSDFLEEANTLREIITATSSAGIRLLSLNRYDQLKVQQEAVAMMAEDWPEYKHLIYGYEPHINMVDEILIWRVE